jgi:uncharacterized membrane protein YfcA
VAHEARSLDTRPLVLSALGAASGALSGLLGVGGAVILVPLLTRVVGMSQHQAHGTSLAIVGFTALAAIAGYAVHGHVDWWQAVPLIAGAVVGSPLGARAAHALRGAALRRAFGIFLLLVGIRLLIPGLPPMHVIPETGFAGTAGRIALGFVVGAMSGFFGVGGGVILVPALVLLAGVAQHVAQGISLVFVVPTAVVGGWTHHRLGNVVPRVVLPIAITSAVVAFAASFAAASVPAVQLRMAFGALLAVLGARTAFFPPKRADA